MRFGEELLNINIKFFRLKALISQKELAEKLEINQSAVSHWERGDTKPCKKYVNKMCALFECTPEELMGDAPNG